MEAILKSNSKRHHRIAFDEDDYTSVYDGNVITGDYAITIHEREVNDATYPKVYEWIIEAESLEPFNFYSDFLVATGPVLLNKFTTSDLNAAMKALYPDGTTRKEAYNASFTQVHPGGLKFRNQANRQHSVTTCYDKGYIDGTKDVPSDVDTFGASGFNLECRLFYKMTTDYLMIKTRGLDCMTLIGKFESDNTVNLRVYKKALTNDGVAI